MVAPSTASQAILLAIFVVVVGARAPKTESSACEELIECYAKSRAKTEECISHTEKHECRNETLQSELKELNDERISLYEKCLRERSPTAAAIENAKKKAKCSAILRKNPTKRSKSIVNDKEKERDEKKKSRRSTRKDKKNAANAQQKACFREARKLRTYCGQLSKCCTINKLCKVNTLVDEKISAKRLEIKEAHDQCRLEHGGGVKAKGAKNHKRGGHHHHHHQNDGHRRKSKNSETDV